VVEVFVVTVVLGADFPPEAPLSDACEVCLAAGGGDTDVLVVDVVVVRIEVAFAELAGAAPPPPADACSEANKFCCFWSCL
jgi:hypothetical protein